MLLNSYFIFDTNILISAHILLDSISFKALNLARRIGIIASTKETFDEFSKSFKRDKFEKYLSIDKREHDINEIRTYMEFFEVKTEVSICRDPDDNKFLSLALATRAACLITGDKDLLVLNPFKNIPILNPAQFISYFNVTDYLHTVNEPRQVYGAFNTAI